MNAIEGHSLTGIVTTDLAAITRGRFVPTAQLEKYIAHGVGWVPANVCITAFDVIATPNPWGSIGDLRLIPDMHARYRTAQTGSPTPFDMILGDLVTLEGSAWACCTRTQLRKMQEDFREETGLTVMAAFEQEFQIFRSVPSSERCFSFGALRQAEPFASCLMAALEEAGIDPEIVTSEYGKDQFEVTCGPSDAVTAADRCIAIREIVRETCRALGWRASFSPKTRPDTAGNGVHIHFSFRDRHGTPTMYDAREPGGLSALAGSFCGGVLDHLPALTALTAPSAPSFMRLKPHNWSSSYTWLADRDREASLRICPIVTRAGRDVSAQFNVEYRPADAIANPYLALAAIIRAGHDGIHRNRPTPPLVTGDPWTMSPEQRTALGLIRLPETYESALQAFSRDSTFVSWFDPSLVESFVALKRFELAAVAGLDDVAVCERYQLAY